MSATVAKARRASGHASAAPGHTPTAKASTSSSKSRPWTAVSASASIRKRKTNRPQPGGHTSVRPQPGKDTTMQHYPTDIHSEMFRVAAAIAAFDGACDPAFDNDLD